MRLQQRSSAHNWARAAFKCGLLLTDTRLWASIGEQLQDRVTDVSDEMQRRYEGAADRLHDAHDALRGRNHWLTPTATLVGGVALGVGLGFLLAPVSGEEARAVLRDKVVDIKNRVNKASDVTAAEATGMYSRSMDSGT